MIRNRLFAVIIVYCSFIFQNHLIGQCAATDQSLWENTWESCELSQSPNPNRGQGHWIMYDLGKQYTLSTTRIWNSNIDLEKGVRNLIVDYSLDGDNWTFLDSIEISKAEGNLEYSGVPGPDFKNTSLRYVLIHIESNWGDADCVGFVEIKFIINQSFDISDEDNNEDDSDESDEDEEQDETEDSDEEDNDDEEEDGEESEENDDEEHDEVCDDEEESEMEGCEPLSNVTSLVLSSSEVWILWEGVSESGYRFYYRKIGEEWKELELEETEVFLEELEADSEYEYYIETLCDEEMVSEIQEFYLPEENEECQPPSVSHVYLSEDFALITWPFSEEDERYQIRYRVVGEEEWETIRVDENILEIEDFESEEEIEYQIRSRCDGEWTEWSDTFYLNGEREEDILSSTDTAIAEQRSLLNDLVMKITPNPAIGSIQFNIESKRATSLSVHLTDAVGSTIYLNGERANSGQNVYRLDASLLQSGLYFLTITDMNSQTSKTEKVLLVNY